MKEYYVYILTNRYKSSLYIGFSNNLFYRLKSHREGLFINSFTRKYKINKLVYYEICSSVAEALIREKQLKKWYRKWKIELKESMNPRWLDLSS